MRRTFSMKGYCGQVKEEEEEAVNLYLLHILKNNVRLR
jgi:hypothetical protein